MNLRTHTHLVLITLLILAAPITAQTQNKSTYLILLDNTGSMKTQFPQVQALAKAIVKRLYQNGPISIVDFKTQADIATVRAGIEPQQDETKLTNYIDGLSTVTGYTALFDAVTSAAETLVEQAKATADTRKVLILITDGDDRMPRTTGVYISSTDEEDRWRKRRDQLAVKLKQSGITTHAVALLRELEDDGLVRLTARQKAESLLTKVTKQTGGRLAISTSKTIDVDKILNKILGP